MSKKPDAQHVSHSDKLKALYARALAVAKLYSQSTGASVYVSDENYTPILEINAEKDCVILYGTCKELHCNAIKESCRLGGSYTYTCKMGIYFWTSPMYLDGQFAGALIGSGFTDSKKIKALAEMLLTCAMYLSTENKSCHSVMRRRAEQQALISAHLEALKKQHPHGSIVPEYPMDKEQELLSAIRHGDIELGKALLNELLAHIFFTNSDQFNHIQYRTIELIILFSRIYNKMGFSAESVFEINKQHIASIKLATVAIDKLATTATDKLTTAASEGTSGIEEITDILHHILGETIAEVIGFKGMQHALALKKAEQFILDHIDKKIVLSEIAKVSGLSVPYFSTIFKEEMGENFSDYLNRVRTEKAALLLTTTDLTLNKIAKLCGFEDQSWFSKIFKLHSGMSPGRFRNQRGKTAAHIPGLAFSDSYIDIIKP